VIGVKPSREYMVPRLMLAAILGGCVGATIAVWRAGGDHASALGPRTGASAVRTQPASASPAQCRGAADDPPAIAAVDTHAGALCEAVAFDGAFGSAVRLGPIAYRRALLEHFAPAARAYAEDQIAAQLKGAQDATRLVDAGGHSAGYSVSVSSHFDSYSSSQAVVELWGLFVEATDATAPTDLLTTPLAVWGIDRVHLAYTVDGWRVTQLDEVPGPTPVTPQIRVLNGIPEQLTWEPVADNGVGRR
jgi:hypothetical protein